MPGFMWSWKCELLVEGVRWWNVANGRNAVGPWIFGSSFVLYASVSFGWVIVSMGVFESSLWISSAKTELTKNESVFGMLFINIDALFLLTKGLCSSWAYFVTCDLTWVMDQMLTRLKNKRIGGSSTILYWILLFTYPLTWFWSELRYFEKDIQAVHKS